MDIVYVKLKFADGCKNAIDMIAVDNGVADNMY